MSIMFTQFSAIVNRMVVSLPNAPTLDAAHRIVEKQKAELVRRLVLAAIFKSRESIFLDIPKGYLAFRRGWVRHVVHRSLGNAAFRLAAVAVPACPQSDEIVAASRNAIIVKKLAVTVLKPHVPVLRVEDIASVLGGLSACIPALDGLWFDGIPVLHHDLQSDIPPMTLSTIIPWKAHANIDLILLLASCFQGFTLHVSLPSACGPWP
ncbi:hypothetical protein BD779DRAFT_1543769 [Infundibulicybe gibba]|nr:hypothetical protein BD779DRAFT_1543769 [Infundibulicybe gibba]